MATFHFDLVSPEKIAFAGEVEQVDIPGAEGDVGIMAGHAPMVMTLRPGLLTVTVGGKTQKVAVFGGLAEVSAKGLTVLAEVATSAADLDKAALARQIADMEASIAKGAAGSALDREIARLDHFKTLHMQLSATAAH